MKPVFGAEGRRAIAALMARPRVLLGFDFDGTLAPIVARPEEARMPQAVLRRLRELVRRRTVAVVTGRSVDDVSTRLGFEPHYVLGSHGIEDPQAQGSLLPNRWTMALDPLRHVLRQRGAEFAAAGVAVEDKRYSIALHYRLAADEARARSAIDAALDGATVGLEVSAGKCVVNVVPAGAPDKGDAMLLLAQRCEAEAGMFVGDDLNDEPVFAKVPADWVTVRVARDHVLSQAAFYLDGTAQLPALLDLLLEHRPPP